MVKIRVGHAGRQYPEKRNIIGLVPEAEYRLCRDWFSLQSRVAQLLNLDRSGNDAWFDRQFRFQDFGFNRIDCIHLFNSINYSRKPWLLTFETLVPRFRSVLTERESNPSKVAQNRQVREALEAMSRQTCLALLPISQSAANIQADFLSLFPEYKYSLTDKMHVLHPPQNLIENDPERIEYPSERSDTIRFMMVGHQFFRKGGREILNVLAQLRRELNVDLRLCVVSQLSDDGYATEVTEADYRNTLDFIINNEDWIKHYPVLQPHEVLREMRTCDVGLLPSYAETYGYSVLEFQAAGRPVITTNVRAFPEINNDDCGWLIPVPKKEVGGEAFFKTTDEREELSRAIRSGLYDIVKEIIEKPGLVREKGIRAWERIRDEHDPVAVGEFLRKVYQGALS